MVLIMPPQDILFLDTNICIKIYQVISRNISYNNMDDRMKLLKDKNRHNTVVFTFPYLLEGGYRKKGRDYEENICETLYDAECIKKFFDKSLCDTENFKRLEGERKNLGVGQLDFQFERQIRFYESLHDIIYCGLDKRKNITIQDKIINEAIKCGLKLYYPLVIVSIAVLYQNKNNNSAEYFLKLRKQRTEGLSNNVVNDMTNILRFSSSSYEFIIKYFENSLHLCNIEFITDDAELDKFIKFCNMKELYYLIKGKLKGSCPINRKYFPLVSDKEWKYLQNLFSVNYI